MTLSPPKIVHGKRWAYTVHGCRCPRPRRHAATSRLARTAREWLEVEMMSEPLAVYPSDWLYTDEATPHLIRTMFAEVDRLRVLGGFMLARSVRLAPVVALGASALAHRLDRLTIYLT